MAYKISKEDMEKELALGKTLRQIGREYGISKSMIQYIAKKYDVESDWSRRVNIRRLDDRFNKVNCKEVAYIVGFLLGDGSIDTNNDYVNVAQCIRDKEVIEWMAKYLNIEPTYDMFYDKKSKRFPHIQLSCHINYISKYLGHGLKIERHYPIVAKEFEPYLLRGLFDADGCICGGARYDRPNRSRFWWRYAISHHKKCLEGVQKFLYTRLGISSIVKTRGRSANDCYNLEINNVDMVQKVMDFMYQDVNFMPFTRKYEKYIALRLESDKFMEWKKNPLPNHEPIIK